MTTTTNLNATHWTAGQAQPEVTVNTALDIFDGKVAGILTIDSSGDTDVTLATTGSEPFEWQRCYIEVENTGTAWTANRNLNVPAEAGPYMVYNNNGAAFSVNVQVTGGAGVGITIANGKTAIVYCDGADVRRVTADN